MQLEEHLLTVFTANIDDTDGIPVIHVPERELDLGDLSTGETYQVAIRETPGADGGTTDNAPSTDRQQKPAPSSEPPVAEGDQLDVEIEGVGEQGDGVARVGPGYIVFVPDTAVGDRVTIEITEVRDNFGFAEVVTPEPVTG